MHRAPGGDVLALAHTNALKALSVAARSEESMKVDDDALEILYVGPNEGTSRQRFEALRRLGHSVLMVDPFDAVSSNRYVRSWIFHTGALGCERSVQSFVTASVGDKRFDLALVDSGELIGPALVEQLRGRAGTVVNFNQDNPYVAGRRFRLFRKALSFYDLIVTSRDSSVQAARAAGARNVLRVTLAADEVVHRPRELSAGDRAVFSSDVVFAGTWMPERGPFFRKLVECGVPLRIFGPRWNRSREFAVLKPYTHVAPLGDEEYVKAIAGAKIALGLVSKANLDFHTTRSLEIPAIGTLFCAQRTPDHVALYRDGEEAVFWDSPEECARLCLDLLRDPERISRIASAGHRRAHLNRNFNEDLLTQIIDAAMALTDQPQRVISRRDVNLNYDPEDAVAKVRQSGQSGQ